MRVPGILSMIVLLGWCGPLMAQWQVGPIYPERPEVLRYDYRYNLQTTPSNYDPFRFNPYTGRFDYAPIPFDYQRPAVNYGAPNGVYAPYGVTPYAPPGNYMTPPLPPQVQAPAMGPAENQTYSYRYNFKTYNYRTHDPAFDRWYTAPAGGQRERR